MSGDIILGIETSCDDTSVAIIKEIAGQLPEMLSHVSFSQEKILAKWGGVVPEIAARNHLEKIMPLVEQALTDSNKTLKDIDLIGVTTHPGLLGPLLTGLNAAKTLALLNKSAIMPVNHLYAHLEAIHLTEKINYPYLGLLVSGGHGLYMLVTSSIDFEIIGSTIDDAPGEAFDKGAKLIGLGYPGGKMIDDLSKDGDKTKFEFPIGIKGSKNANLSYSGVKTSLRQFLEKNPTFYSTKEEALNRQDIKDMCASYQNAIVKALILKMRYALQITKEKTGIDLPIVIGGGVASNSELRSQMKDKYQNVYCVAPKFCTDNGAMIANYAMRTKHKASPFPECLYIDAKGKFINKSERLKAAKNG